MRKRGLGGIVDPRVALRPTSTLVCMTDWGHTVEVFFTHNFREGADLPLRISNSLYVTISYVQPLCIIIQTVCSAYVLEVRCIVQHTKYGSWPFKDGWLELVCRVVFNLPDKLLSWTIFVAVGLFWVKFRWTWHELCQLHSATRAFKAIAAQSNSAGNSCWHQSGTFSIVTMYKKRIMPMLIISNFKNKNLLCSPT